MRHLLTLIAVWILAGVSLAEESQEVYLEKDIVVRIPVSAKREFLLGPDFVVHTVRLNGELGVVIYLGDHPNVEHLDLALRKEVQINGMKAGMWRTVKGAVVKRDLVIELPKNREAYQFAHVLYEVPLEDEGRAREISQSFAIKKSDSGK